MSDKNYDPDYRMLSCYLKYHYAPQIFHSALERIIKRAGLRVPPEPITEEKPQRPRKMADYDTVFIPPVPPIKREPIREYLDAQLGVMVKVCPPAYARLK